MREAFEKLLHSQGVYEEFCIEMREYGIWNNLAELCSKVTDADEFVSEAFDWKMKHWENLDHEWKVLCGTKRRFKHETEGYNV